MGVHTLRRFNPRRFFSSFIGKGRLNEPRRGTTSIITDAVSHGSSHPNKICHAGTKTRNNSIKLRQIAGSTPKRTRTNKILFFGFISSSRRAVSRLSVVFHDEIIFVWILEYLQMFIVFSEALHMEET